jgi:hypothetical protein
MRLKKKLQIVSGVILSTVAGFANAVAPVMGDIINNNVDISSVSDTATAIVGSAVTVAGLVAAARVGKRLIGSL